MLLEVHLDSLRIGPVEARTISSVGRLMHCATGFKPATIEASRFTAEVPI